MALTRASALWYWDAAYGVAPVVGGAPEFDRESGAYFRDARGDLRGPLPIDTPVRERILVGTEYRTALRLEPAATNLVTISEPTAAQLSSKSAGVVDGSMDARGLGPGVRIPGNTGVTEYAYMGCTLVAGTAYTIAFFVQMDDGGAPVPGASTWAGADFTLVIDNTMVASVGAVERWAGNLYRVRGTFTATVGGASRYCGVARYTTQSQRGLTVVGFQVTATPYASSYIPTTGTTVSRASDVPAFRAPPAPQAMGGFCEFVAGMDNHGGVAQSRVWQIGATADGNPRMLLRHNDTSMALLLYDSAGLNVYTSPLVAPTVGQRVRVGWALRADASLYAVVQLDDDAPVASGPSAALASGIPTAWSSPARLSLSGVGAAARGRHYHLRNHIVTLADMDSQPGVATAADFLSEIEDYYLDPAGNLI